jgi:hypothetical protein
VDLYSVMLVMLWYGLVGTEGLLKTSTLLGTRASRPLKVVRSTGSLPWVSPVVLEVPLTH